MDAKSYLLSIENTGIKLGLDRTIKIMDACGNPQNQVKAIQVAGTNGKGSTSAMMAKILEKAGYKVGLSTSPHLVHVNERIRINGIPITDEDIHEFISNYKKDIESIGASFFESVTAMGFWYFHRKNVDIAIMETGLGGRLDSVTICNPILTVITTISLDHTEILGDSIEKIAYEKAGIMKKKIPCITTHQQTHAMKELVNHSKKIDCPLIKVKDKKINYQISLSGKYQLDNAILAITALKNLNGFPVSDEDIQHGLMHTTWHARYQVVQKNPLVIFDVGHNEMGILGTLNEISKIEKKSILVLSLQRRKKIKNIVNNIKSIFNIVICCETDNPRTMTLAEIENQIGKNVLYIKSPFDAIYHALSIISDNDVLAIVGTHHLGEPVSRIFNKSFDTL